MFESYDQWLARQQFLEQQERDRKSGGGSALWSFLRGFRSGIGGKSYSVFGALLGGAAGYAISTFAHEGTSTVSLVLLGGLLGLFWKWVLGIAVLAALAGGTYWLLYRTPVS